MFSTMTACEPKVHKFEQVRDDVSVEDGYGAREWTKSFKVRSRPDMMIGSYFIANPDGKKPKQVEYIEQLGVYKPDLVKRLKAEVNDEGKDGDGDKDDDENEKESNEQELKQPYSEETELERKKARVNAAKLRSRGMQKSLWHSLKHG